jgi:hypothetical protein
MLRLIFLFSLFLSACAVQGPSANPSQSSMTNPGATPNPAIQPTPPPTVCDTIGEEAFYGCYYDNMDFTGLKFTRIDNSIDFTWGVGSPAGAIEPEKFSILWRGHFQFAAGNFEFRASSDDGIKVYIDGELIVDGWGDHPETEYRATKNISAGKHLVRVEYFENSNEAVARFSWNKVADPTATPQPTPISGALFPIPNHLIDFGYYFADGRYGDFTGEVNSFTNLYIAVPNGYDTALDWRPLFQQSLQQAFQNNKTIMLLMGDESIWEEVLAIAKPVWSKVKYIEVLHEQDIGAGECENKINRLKARLAAHGLPNRLMGTTASGASDSAASVEWVGIEAYVNPPGSSDSSANVNWLNNFLEQEKAKVAAGKKIVMIMQAYDRNGLWPNISTLKDIQAPAYMKSYNDPRVTAIAMFSYARPGGARDHQELKLVHEQIAQSIFTVTPLSETASAGRLGATTALNTVSGGKRHTDAAFDPINNVFLAIHGSIPIGGAFISADGAQIGAPFKIVTTDLWTQTPSTVYSRDLGGFLVTWMDTRYDSRFSVLMGRLLRYTPSGVQFLTDEFRISSQFASQEDPAGVLYSPTSREFFVTWKQSDPLTLKARRIGLSGEFLGPEFDVNSGYGWREKQTASYNPDLNEYLVAHVYYSTEEGGVVKAQRVKAGTDVLIGPTFNISTSTVPVNIPQVQYDTKLKRYMAAWFQGGFFTRAVSGDAVSFGPVNQIAPGFGSYDGFSMAYNPVSGSFYSVFHGSNAENFGAQITSDGRSLTVIQVTQSGAVNGNYNPRIAANTNRAEWLIVTTHDFNTVVFQRVGQ